MQKSTPTIKTLRLSETISPFGIGAVADILGESLMGPDAHEWKTDDLVEVHMDRLAAALRVNRLYGPPSVPDRANVKTPGLNYVRFPAWLFCQQCGRMTRIKKSDETGSRPACPHCQGRLVPMRFVAVCRDNSHISDIPWTKWVHRNTEAEPGQTCQATDALIFETLQGRGEGLAALRVRCKACGSHRSISDLSGRSALSREGFACLGGQPWQFIANAALCGSKLEVIQRGASNAYFPEIIPALDIPEADYTSTGADQIRSHKMFPDLADAFAAADSGPVIDVLSGLIATQLGTSTEEVLAVARSESSPADIVSSARAELREGEHRAFASVLAHPLDDVSVPNFEVLAEPFSDGDDDDVFLRLGELVEGVVRVERLREVRSFYGFRRYSTAATMVPAHIGPYKGARWLPAVEGHGEGIYLELNGAKTNAWELDPAVQRRIEILESRRGVSRVGVRLREMTPRFVLLHTLAHLLMRSLSFTSGYAAASLRERVYAAPDQAGILIYTVENNPLGTLGGLVREAHHPRLARTVLDTLTFASWCSNDPICGEHSRQGMDGLNLAACHACSLSAETSCENSNVGLDRKLLIGDNAIPGYFAGVFELAMQRAIQ